MKSLPLAFVALAAVVSGCGSGRSGNPPIDPGANLGVTAIVRALDTEQPIGNATVVLGNADDHEQLAQSPDEVGIYTGGRERPGVYALTVAADGYAPQTIPHVELKVQSPPADVVVEIWLDPDATGGGAAILVDAATGELLGEATLVSSDG